MEFSTFLITKKLVLKTVYKGLLINNVIQHNSPDSLIKYQKELNLSIPCSYHSIFTLFRFGFKPVVKPGGFREPEEIRQQVGCHCQCH